MAVDRPAFKRGGFPGRHPGDDALEAKFTYLAGTVGAAVNEFLGTYPASRVNGDLDQHYTFNAVNIAHIQFLFKIVFQPSQKDRFLIAAIEAVVKIRAIG